MLHGGQTARSGKVINYKKDIKMSLYANMNKRKKAGTSRPKNESTIDPETYEKMKEKRGGFKPKIKSK